MKKYLLVIILLYLSLSLQFSFNLKFDLLLIIILCYSLLKGIKNGAILGFIIGLICDLTISIYLGCYTLSKTIIASLTGILKGKVLTYNIILPILIVTIGSIFYTLIIFVTVSIITTNFDFSYFKEEFILKKSVYNGCISPFVYIIMKKII